MFIQCIHIKSISTSKSPLESSPLGHLRGSAVPGKMGARRIPGCHSWRTRGWGGVPATLPSLKWQETTHATHATLLGWWAGSAMFCFDSHISQFRLQYDCCSTTKLRRRCATPWCRCRGRTGRPRRPPSGLLLLEAPPGISPAQRCPSLRSTTLQRKDNGPRNLLASQAHEQTRQGNKSLTLIAPARLGVMQ